MTSHKTTRSATHINNLPNDVLARILWHTSRNSDCHALRPKQQQQHFYSIVLDAVLHLGEETFPLPTPSAVPNAAKIFLVSLVCCRWRDLAQRDVSTLLVYQKHVISRQHVSSAITCFSNLTDLRLCYGSVDNLDDAFLAHLASACPKLTILHVGCAHTQRLNDIRGKHLHPITEAGLDRFFQRYNQLEQLSFLCLHRDAVLPPSFFQLTRLHTLRLAAVSALEAPDLESLVSLTTLHIDSTTLNDAQLANVRRLPSITNLSVSFQTAFSLGDPGSPAFTISQLTMIKSWRTCQLLLLDWPCTSLERLRLLHCRELKRFPNDFAELLPSIRKLTIFECPLLEELPESFCSLKHLETLLLFSCSQFRRLPENIGSLCALKTLGLERLPLESLPDSVCQLSSLETFSLLSCAPIRELSARFGCLTSLTTLCLGRVALPADVGRLSNLRTLVVRESSQQRHLPSSLSEISSLTSLSLHQCGVEELPEAVGEMSNLRDLHVSSCTQLVAVPASLTCLNRLEALTLTDCASLTSVPTRWDGLTRLKWLDVTACGELTGPDQLLPASLEALSWGSDMQAMLLPDISRLTGLRGLSLIRVAVAARGLAVSRSLSHLERLTLNLGDANQTLAGDHAEELPFPLTLLSHLRTLHIRNAMSLQTLPADIGSALPQLRKLTLFRVGELRELPASVTALQSLTSLEVNLANKMVSLPHDIGALSRLRELLLIHCTHLEHLPASLTQLACLNEMLILRCSIRSLSPNFSWLARLRSLHLSGCAQLQALPADLSEMKALQELIVEGCNQLTDVDWSVLPRSSS